MKRTLWLVLILAVFVGIVGSSPAFNPSISLAQTNPLSPQQQATQQPDYLQADLLLDATVTLDKCFVGYINSGMVPCDAAPGTDPGTAL